jgi:hypothetical protein
MVLTSRPSRSASRSVSEWVWPNPSRLGKARYVLRDLQEGELLDHLKQHGVSAGSDLTTMEAGLVEALKKFRLTRRTASVEMLNFARVSSCRFLFSLAGGLF